MTIAELISELRASRELFDWQYHGNSKSIRGFLKTGDITVPFDPLGAVCYVRTNRILDDAHRGLACGAVGLSSRDCSDVTEASNSYLQQDAEGKGSPDIYKQWLRRQLVFAVGLNSGVILQNFGKSFLINVNFESPLRTPSV